RGELDAAGFLVARAAGGLQGVLAFQPLRGASGLVWPPVADTEPVEDLLVRHALDFLTRRGAKIAQALLPPLDAHLGVPLLRQGFQQVTILEYLRHPLDQQSDLAEPADSEESLERLTYRE